MGAVEKRIEEEVGNGLAGKTGELKLSLIECQAIKRITFYEYIPSEDIEAHEVVRKINKFIEENE